MKIGIIGTGNMGTILTEALLDGKVASPSDVMIVNRTKLKAERLKNKYGEIVIADSVGEVIRSSNLIFLCVKPRDFPTILKENEQFFRNHHCLVSITSPVQSSWLEEMIPCSCARIIPSITNRAFSGVTLFTFGTHCQPKWRETLLSLFSTISVPVQIEENVTRISSDIVSCGPAFYSYMTRRFIEAAVAETEIKEEVATILFEQMLIGLGELLKKGYYTLPELEKKVTVKGGITGEGIQVLETELNGVFEQVIQATHKKFQEEVDELKEKFTYK